MKPLLTSAEAAALDRASEERGIRVESLMERAGFAVARAAVRAAGGAYGRRAVIVCGKGNNGGDGLVAARHLARWGMGATVQLLFSPEEIRGPAAAGLDRLRYTTARVRAAAGAGEGLAAELARSDVVVDAIFGSGFRGEAEGLAAAAIEAVNSSRLPVVAVDVPSGVETDTGLVRGPAIVAAITVSMGAPKLGAVLFPGASHAGAVEVAGIGFPAGLVAGEVLLVETKDVRALLPARGPDDHKRRSGVVLVIGGSAGMTGAPRLVAEGAYRGGAGLVRVAAPMSAIPAIQAGLAEATFVALPEGPGGAAAESAWDSIEAGDADAIAVGPGLSTSGEAPAFARRVVLESPVPLVVDADAINAFAGQPGELARRRSEAVLTPHTSELARLFGIPAQEVLDDRVGIARKAASETGCVVLLKGARSVIASPEGELRVNPTGSPALATGGTGDVLAGVIAAYLARGLLPLEAATAGAYVHGLAGELLAEGAVAGDVARAIPEVVARVRG